MGAVICALLVALSACSPQFPASVDSGPYEGTTLSGEAPDFRLRDQGGASVQLSDFRGQVVVLAFMDSECQEICPLTSVQLRQTHASLAQADAQSVMFLAVNVNPSANRIEDVQALADALEAGDLAAAQEAAAAVHSSQHDLAHDTYAWVGSDVEFVAAPQSAAEPDDEEVEGGELPDEYADAQVVSLVVDDWYWDPTTVELEMGVPVVLEITNEGALPHGIWVPLLNINVNTPAGETSRVPITPEETGTFTILCNNDLCGSAEQHANMIAKIVVVE